MVIYVVSIAPDISKYFRYLFQNDIEYLTEPLFGNDKGNSAFSKILLQDNPIRGMSSAFLDELIDGGAMNLSCEQLILPTIREQLTVTCLRPSTVMVMNVSNDAARWFQTRGFYCIETQVDNLNECTSCPTGTYSSTSSAVTCQACPRGGFYQDQVGQYSSDITPINCKNCTEGTFVWEGSGKDPLSCKVCPTGTNKNAFAGFRACFCLENYFRRDRFDECELCPQEGVQCKDDYMTIRQGYYWNWSYTDIAEYKRFVENLLTFNESYEETATRFNGSLPKAHKCLKSGRCANDVDQITGNCAKGYTGWMCTICDEEFFPIFGHCHPCPALKYFILETSIIFIVLALFLFLLFKSYQYQRRRSRSLVDSTLALVKIVLGFYQIMAEFWESIDVIFWPQFFKSIAAWLDILQFNISSILIKPKCFWPAFEITPYTAFTLGAMFPYFSTACAILAIGASNFWYWEIIELGRKVSQTLVIVVLGWNSSFSVTITLTLAVIFLSLHISFRPMEDNIEHYLQLASLWVIFFNMLLAAVPASDSSSGHLTTDILVTCLVILNTGVLVIAVVVTILKMVRIMCNKNCFRQGENEQQPEDFINEIAPLLS
ncbi:hypothetical protein BSL78_09759 [Apostichopus japonicus]|uniref:Tyrosine-protein kinase ephrin type A/B receptor-like domain-containing protein n=1 Tax=Stichopus japonicus TaxID=307972 RepID=A0A2G8KZE7_STIJA|nr:hypothetical protein BSL78_09759 [Apostichopus japonicus]